MPWYRAGTVSVSPGSAAVAGSGTSWVANARPGDALVLPDGTALEILSVPSDGALTLVAPYAGTEVSGSSYAIWPTAASLRDLAAQVASLVSLYQAVSSNPAIAALEARVTALETP